MVIKRKLYWGAGILGAIILLFLVGVFVNRQLYQQKLLKEGIRTEAQVINKYHLKNKKGLIKKSYIELAVFEDTTAVVRQQNKPQKEPTNINDKIDDLFNNFGSKALPTGDYKTKAILVDLSQYDAIKIGSTKTFVYLKDEVDKGMLLTKLE
ncbi:MAG: hypothetical protein R2816_00060 [Flavobacteriaceae bacterium]|nr:hypothetical protein [Flavobacteriaceae bacterium]